MSVFCEKLPHSSSRTLLVTHKFKINNRGLPFIEITSFNGERFIRLYSDQNSFVSLVLGPLELKTSAAEKDCEAKPKVTEQVSIRQK